ncbi:MAG: glycoside hydrolase family 43 protein [Eubacteriales bacterium]|nr:glycoside hydrolase family 43 protein [Eubacteriales bacterium]
MIQNPILRGFCPDPSIVRVGRDYFIAVSTFEWWPGVRIYHSTDLEHFQQLPSPLNRAEQLSLVGNPDSGGVWAPDLSFDGKRFWLVYTDVKTRNGGLFNTHNYLVRTEDIRSGVWSAPVYLNSTGFDPSILHDTDGKMYLVNMVNGFKGVLVQEYDPEKECLVGEAKNVYPGTGRDFTEGPHIYHIGDWYYLMMAEGGTAYEHCETMARAKSIWGPYEADPENPVLTSEMENEHALQKCGHADLVQTQTGEWYLVHLCSRPPKGTKLSVLGRETALQKVCWNEEGWLRLSCGGRYAQRETKEPEGLEAMAEIPVKDKEDFDGIAVPGAEFSSLRIPAEGYTSLTERPGYLRMYGQESLNSRFRVSIVARRQTEYHCMAETALEFCPECPEQAAGLAYLYDTRNFFLLLKTADETGRPVLVLLKSDRGNVTGEAEIPCPETDGIVYLRAETFDSGLKVRFLYSADGEQYAVLKEETTEILTDEHCIGFTGAHFGMYCHDMTGRRKAADFDYFRYRVL